MKPLQELNNDPKSGLLVVFNPMCNGGKSHRKFQDFIQYLDSEKWIYSIYTTTGKEDQKQIRDILESENIKIISVCGGDGTLNLVLNSMDDFNYKLHLVPLGSGNDFARTLYGDTYKITDVLNWVHSNQSQKIDVWKCNDIKFMNMFGCGFDGKVAYNTTFKKSYLPSKFKYWIEIIRNLFFFKAIKVDINGKKGFLFLFAAANGKTVGGNFKLAPEAKPNDNLLDIIWIKKVTTFQRIWYIMQLKKGKKFEKSFISRERTNSIAIKSEKPLFAHLDGEALVNDCFKISYAGVVNFLFF